MNKPNQAKLERNLRLDICTEIVKKRRESTYWIREEGNKGFSDVYDYDVPKWLADLEKKFPDIERSEIENTLKSEIIYHHVR